MADESKAADEESTKVVILPNEEELLEELPDMEAAHQRFICSCPAEVGADKETAKEALLAIIKRDNMAKFYSTCCAELGWEVDEALLAQMNKSNADELASFAAKKEDADENLGEQEAQQFIYGGAKVHTKNGDAAAAIAAYGTLLETYGKKMSTSQKIQINLNCVRLSLFNADLTATKDFLDKTRKLVEDGGDWDRRNRLRVYEGHYYMMTRNFAAASKVFLDSVPTFTAVEVCSFEKLVLYAATCGVLQLDRVTLAEKLVGSPEVIAVSRETPFLGEFVNALYECRYADFFKALVGIQSAWRADRFLAPHVPWLLREMRVRAYVQFLTSYRSVTLDATAAAFGVSAAYVDEEFSRFVAAGRLNAKIDKVSGIVETNQPDARNAQYQQVIKQGDLLLNRVQKLARVVNV